MVPDLLNLLRIALSEFSDLVVHGEIVNAKLRLFIKDGSYIDFWWSEIQEGRFAHHWDRRMVDGSIFRHDNSPHTRWRSIGTFPKHFHRETDEDVEESRIPDDPQEALLYFLKFCRFHLVEKSSLT